MDRNPPPSLPRLRDMVPMPLPRETPLPPNASWTAINQLPRPEGPVSPRTTHATPQLNAQPSPPSHHHDRTENRAQPRDQTTSTSSLPANIYRGRSFDGPPVDCPAEHQTAGKPINARQDSAVFPSATSIAPTTLHPGNVSRSERSPEFHHRPARETATHPLTPPSDPSFYQSYSRGLPTYAPTHARTPTPSTTGARQDAVGLNSQRRRARSDPDVNRPDVRPLPHTALFNEKNTMPPPPVPPVTLPSEFPTTTGAVLLPSSTAAPHQTPRHPQDALDNDEEGSVVKCPFCHDTWTHPPPTMPKFNSIPPDNFQESNQSMIALCAFSHTYKRERDASYTKWKQAHSGGHCNCMDHASGSKRKFEDSEDSTSPASKSQKRDSESPPRISHLTPPPDQANGEAASTSSFDPKTGFRVPDTTARVLGPYKPPRHDSDGMFHDVHGEGQRVKTEGTAR